MACHTKVALLTDERDQARASRDAWKERALLAEAQIPDPVEPPPVTPPPVPVADGYPAFNSMPLGQVTSQTGMPGWQLGWGGEYPAIAETPGDRPGRCAKFSVDGTEGGRSEIVKGSPVEMIAPGARTVLPFGLYLEAMDWGWAGKGHNLCYQYQGGGGAQATSPRASLALFDEAEGPGLYVHGVGIGWGVFCAPLALGRWYDIVVEAVCSNTGTGQFIVKLDGKTVFSAGGLDTIRDDQTWAYQKLGDYRAASMTGLSVVYIDTI
jgi:hypothetical protein